MLNAVESEKIFGKYTMVEYNSMKKEYFVGGVGFGLWLLSFLIVFFPFKITFFSIPIPFFLWVGFQISFLCVLFWRLKYDR